MLTKGLLSQSNFSAREGILFSKCDTRLLVNAIERITESTALRGNKKININGLISDSIFANKTRRAYIIDTSFPKTTGRKC